MYNSWLRNILHSPQWAKTHYYTLLTAVVDAVEGLVAFVKY